jgi:four helix bundle protein
MVHPQLSTDFSMVFTFHKLQVWHLAKGLVIAVYKLTRKFPPDEKFGLVSQINRAAVSIASNLAEGSGRISRKDQAHFTQLAYGSLMEVACQLEIAKDFGYISDEDLQAISCSMKTVAEKLSALRTSQLSSLNDLSSSRTHQ